MSTHNIGFYGDLTKIIFQLSNMYHISSSGAMSYAGICSDDSAINFTHQHNILIFDAKDVVFYKR